MATGSETDTPGEIPGKPTGGGLSLASADAVAKAEPASAKPSDTSLIEVDPAPPALAPAHERAPEANVGPEAGKDVAPPLKPPSSSSQVEPLMPEQLAERLALNSSGLVEEIHALSLRQVQQEDARETRLDAKAGGLLGTAGLSLTVAFTFGGLLLQHPDYLLPLGPTLARIVLIAYVVALVAGLAAVIAAVVALFVNDNYESVSEDNVFNEAILDKIDRAAKDKEGSQRLYRRYITVKHWTIYRAHFAIHQKKANKIRWGQGFFLLFLGILIIIGALLTYATFEQYQDVETPKATAPSIDL
jgi:hypothetical protein